MKKDFTSKNNHLHFSGVDTTEIAKEYGTPTFILSHDIISSRCQEIKKEYLDKYDRVRAVYAGKAFSSISMCKMVEREGFGLDVVSGGELFVAKEANFPMKDIIFHGNNKSYEELVEAVKLGVGRIVVDNLGELESLNEITKKLGVEANIYFRVTPGVESDTHSYISTGQVDSKFGIPIVGGIIFEAVKRVISMELVNFKGLHFHVGSQLQDNTSHIGAINSIKNIVETIKKDYDVELEDLNIGGGFGISYSSTTESPLFSSFIGGIMSSLEEAFSSLNLRRPNIVIEPGRWIVGDAGITIYKVGEIKDIPEVRRYLSVDGGMTDNLRPSLYSARYDATIANKFDDPKENLVTVVGKCCESGDVLIKDIKLQDANKDDILAVFNTGAYGYSMANNYNKALKPAVVLVSNGNHGVIVKREELKDLTRLDLVPEFLK